MNARKEKRVRRTLRVLLSSGSQPAMTEYVSTEDVSSYGVRLRTDRPWKPDTGVSIKSLQGELATLARVVYCQSLKSKTFALGLEFLARTRDWHFSCL